MSFYDADPVTPGLKLLTFGPASFYLSASYSRCLVVAEASFQFRLIFVYERLKSPLTTDQPMFIKITDGDEITLPPVTDGSCNLQPGEYGEGEFYG